MKLPNKFDRKFKNGVDNFELTPKSNSWDQVAEKIDQNNNYHFWMVSAAAVSLFCIFTFILVQTMSESSTEPVLAVKKVFNSEPPKAIPELKVNKESEVPAIIPKMDIIKITKAPEILEDDNSERSAKVMISLKSKSFEPIAVSEPKFSYQLTYLTSSDDMVMSKKESQRSSLTKILKYARNKAPADIIGDLRTAKNNFLQFEKMIAKND
jgi:hypothetical protein|tara:strand:+ start:92 stop:721 length:630 start_codon:yes stop_codon:yes gene_type:complete